MKRSIHNESVARDVSRRVKRGTRCHVYSSSKNPGLIIAAESFLERDVGLVLEVDPRILSYREQPFTLELESGELLPSRKHYAPRPGIEPRFYTPDYLCGLANGLKVVVEVKPVARLERELDRLEQVKLVLEGLGYRFLILTEEHITQQIAANIRYLKATTATYLQDGLAAAIQPFVQAASERPNWLVTELAQVSPLSLFGVAIAVNHGVFSADLKQDLFAPNTQLRACQGDLTHLQVLPL